MGSQGGVCSHRGFPSLSCNLLSTHHLFTCLLVRGKAPGLLLTEMPCSEMPCSCLRRVQSIATEALFLHVRQVAACCEVLSIPVIASLSCDGENSALVFNSP